MEQKFQIYNFYRDVIYRFKSSLLLGGANHENILQQKVRVFFNAVLQKVTLQKPGHSFRNARNVVDKRTKANHRKKYKCLGDT